MAFDGIDVLAEFGQQSGLVARAGSDFENCLLGRQIEDFQHESNYVRLRNGLTFANGERVVVIRLKVVKLGYKLVTGYASHRCKYALIANTALAQLSFDHVCAAVVEVRIQGDSGFVVICVFGMASSNEASDPNFR